MLWVSLGAAVLLAAMLAFLALARPATNGTGPSPLLGEAAPPIQGPELSGGGHLSLSQFAGHWVLVNFAASWCVPCRQETPQLLDFARRHTVLMVAYDQTDIPHLASFLRSAGARWPAVDDQGAQVAYGVTGIPTSYLVDPEGTVVAVYDGQVNAPSLDRLIARYSPPNGR